LEEQKELKSRVASVLVEGGAMIPVTVIQDSLAPLCSIKANLNTPLSARSATVLTTNNSRRSGFIYHRQPLSIDSAPVLTDRHCFLSLTPLVAPHLIVTNLSCYVSIPLTTI
jgi:hypothetical protein